MARLPLGLHAWRWLGIAVTPLTPLLLRERAARGKEDRARMGERLGIASSPRPEGRLVWIHGASVGESLAALPLIEKLLAEDIRVLVTSGTVTSANMMQARLPAGAIHQYVPLDTPRAAARFLDHWRPAAGLFVESDLWPNLLLEAERRGVKLALINARISERSAAGWRRVPQMARTLLGVFDTILAQDEDFAARFRALGAHDVVVAGSLKADAPPLSCDEDALAAMRTMIANRPVLLAAQTHPGEDETILPAHDQLRARFPDLLTIIVPRHVERGPDIAMLCGARPNARRAAGEPVTANTAVYVADTMNELGLFYRLPSFCFLGGTLVPMQGHNPLEPAILNCAVLAGPSRANSARAFEEVLRAQGFGDVQTSADIAREAERLLADPEVARAAGAAAARGAAKLSGAVEKTIGAVKSLLGTDARA
ncbi:MAG: 3-deoxy-D-manno-octulosonic acid transferase [Alphaproteobacteria bacterium]|nr:3-deoxy-D-manno-octulosonic acid transferase [Alphaproteobacteria bacterium]